MSPTFTTETEAAFHSSDGLVTVYQGDAQQVLATLPEASVDSVVTDPPYGLSREPDVTEVLKHWLAGDDYVHRGGGFMGKTWDSFVPGPTVWREVYRVLKPGGHAIVFSSSRTFDLTVIALRLAGFEVRDSLHWVTSQGLPKSMNVSRMLDKNGFGPDLVKTFADYGTALKPAHEIIALVRKPLPSTVVATIAEHGTGALNIGACRVPLLDENNNDTNAVGRYPSNFLLTHSEFCLPGNETLNDAGDRAPTCVAGCPVAELDAQSGIRTSGKPGVYRGTPKHTGIYGADQRPDGSPMLGFGDSGGASRFFPSFRYEAKAKSHERAAVWVPAAGCSPDPHNPNTPWEQASSASPRTCEDCGSPWERYQHLTVKPGPLMDWLVSLVTPAGGVTLDLYAGSGSTGLAATRVGVSSVLIERDPVHVGLIHSRLYPSVPVGGVSERHTPPRPVPVVDSATQGVGGPEGLFELPV